MFDFLLKNIEISILLWFLSLSILLFFTIKNGYIKQKILWWLYIIIIFLICFIIPYWSYLFVWIIWFLSIYEFNKLAIYSKIKNIIVWLWFLLLLWWLWYFIIQDLKTFFYIFIFISFSDIVAYTVWKNIVWKKWFTSLSPNKTLSWVLWQIIFLAIMCFFVLKLSIIVSIIVWFLAPIWDLLESYFKRKASLKDTADYIPWHWWVLDRIDSSILTINFILIIWYFQI